MIFEISDYVIRRMIRTIYILFALVSFSSCTNKEYSFEEIKSNIDLRNGTITSGIAFKGDTTGFSDIDSNKHLTIPDTMDLCYSLVKEKTITEFIQNQKVKFVVQEDTVINDERGIFLGKKVIYGNSFIQWIDDFTVSLLEIRDQEIVLNYGIHCNMSREELIRILGINNGYFDTLTVESGFLTNSVQFFFENGKLEKIYLESLPD